jgi:ATP-dependent exoDNAse (exonuclease V) beta subunit
VERGYAMTIHNAQGLTVDGRWSGPDGAEQSGTVLVHAPGADNPALYVALSRHKERVLLYGSRQELESPQEEYLAGGRPRDDLDRLRRVAEQLAEQARSTEASADDRPVLEDLARAPRRAAPGRVDQPDGSDRIRRGAARTTARRIAERYRGTRRPAPVHVDRREWADPEYSWPAPEPELRGQPRDAYREPEPPRRDSGIER